MADRTGTILCDRYRLTARIGEGGMGMVYAAEHLRLGKQVAVKILSDELARDPDQRRRFRAEAEVMAELEHKHIVGVADIGEAGGVPFFVMEYLVGEDLATVLEREGRVSWLRARAIGLQLCSALAATHARKIVHRDLKPSNCFLVKRAEPGDFVKVLDFGIAKRLDRSGRRSQADSVERVDSRRWRNTATGEVFGTMAYMAPEHFFEETVDHRIDVYALGVILYEMLTGRTPLDVGHVGRFVDDLRYLIPAPPSAVAVEAGIPADMDYLVLRALAKRPEDRFADMAEFGAALAGARMDQVVAPLQLPAPVRVAAAPAVEVEEAATRIWRPGDELPGVVRAPVQRSRRGWWWAAIVVVLGIVAASVAVAMHVAPRADEVIEVPVQGWVPVPVPVPVNEVVPGITPVPAAAATQVARGEVTRSEVVPARSPRQCTPLSPAELGKLLAPAAAGVAACKQGLPGMPLKLELTLDGGRVTGKPMATTTLKRRDMATCIGKQLRKLVLRGRLADCHLDFVHDF